MGTNQRFSVGFILLLGFFTSFCVTAHEASPTRDVSHLVRVEASGFRIDHSTQEIVQRVRVRNRSRETLSGSMVLVLDDVPPGIIISNSQDSLKDKISYRFTSAGSGAVSAAKKTLPAGGTADFIVRFKNPEQKPIRYKSHFYQIP